MNATLSATLISILMCSKDEGKCCIEKSASLGLCILKLKGFRFEIGFCFCSFYIIKIPHTEDKASLDRC